MKETLQRRDFFSIWFVCAMTIAEISTGSLMAPLGLFKGLIAILVGHILGMFIFFLCGNIGSREKMAAIESTTISYGKFGLYLFSILNIVQLIGWTAVIEVIAGSSINSISTALWGFNHEYFWSILIGVGICLWVLIGTNIGIGKLNRIAIFLLLILVVIFNVEILRYIGEISHIKLIGQISFSQCVILSISMIFSWLPLVSDVTKSSRTKKQGAVYSTVGYFIGSCWMFSTGLLATLITHSYSPFDMALKLKIGLLVLIIVFISSITGSYIDAHSAGIDFVNIFKNFSPKYAALSMAIIGTILIQFLPLTRYINFLTFIGALFAPLFAVVITDYYILRKNHSEKRIHVSAIISWVVGVWVYYFLLQFNNWLSMTLPSMVVTGVLYFLLQKIFLKRRCT
ncbi:MAG: putative hydroxymethylpyrimidine transporter CytX [Fusobacteria bacterium]|nr:putative hydroxymethylpyrimidine transporter CytX [Fusobacteriota bacterium]